MALCEYCRAEIAGQAERLPPPWFDHDKHRVAGQHLSRTRWRILEVLWRRRGLIVSIDSLMALLYHHRVDDPPDDEIIKVYAAQLRRALRPTPYVIKTVWGCGYMLIEPS